MTRPNNNADDDENLTSTTAMMEPLDSEAKTVAEGEEVKEEEVEAHREEETKDDDGGDNEASPALISNPVVDAAEPRDDDDVSPEQEEAGTAASPQHRHPVVGYRGQLQQQQHPAGYFAYPPTGSGWVSNHHHPHPTPFAVAPYAFGWQQQHQQQQQDGSLFAAGGSYPHHQHAQTTAEQSSLHHEFLAWQQQQQGASAKHTTMGWKGEEEEEEDGERPSKKPRKKKKKTESDAAKSLMLLQTNEDEEGEDAVVPVLLDTPWADLVVGSDFCHAGLRGDVPDSTLVAMGQFRACGLTQDDRVGKYKNREIGFVGMCCKHCGGQPGFGRYFPGSYDSFLNGTNCTGAVKHIKSECRACPQRVREVVLALEAQEVAADKNVASNRPRYGSRKRFFSHVWARLREIKLPVNTGGPDENEIGRSVTEHRGVASNAAAAAAEEEGVVAAVDLEPILADSEIVCIKDRHLVSDTTLVAMAQMKVCVVTEDDKIGRCKDHTLGFKGLCCKHCGGKAGKPGYGRYFPSSLRSLAQADSCQQIIKHVTAKCTQCPPEIRSFILELHLAEGKSGRIRYGSRKIFFRRVWARFHGDVSPEVAEMGESDDVVEKQQAETKNETETTAAAAAVVDDDPTVPWDRVIGDSQVVSLSDRGLISDAQLAAIAQMNLCQLTEADRIGWFKNRDIGFGGLCCKHCGGRPSFGRYFPNSVRSFAQTTSSQTIISHVALYCQECPKDIRDIVMQLQRKENSNEGTVTLNNSMYGSRKVFFDRVWARMHQKDAASAGATTADVDEGVNKPATAADGGTNSGEKPAAAVDDKKKKAAPKTKKRRVEKQDEAVVPDEKEAPLPPPQTSPERLKTVAEVVKV